MMLGTIIMDTMTGSGIIIIVISNGSSSRDINDMDPSIKNANIGIISVRIRLGEMIR